MKEKNINVEYTGIDIGPQIIDDCKYRHPEADWQVMDVQNLNFTSGSYDIVHIRHVLEHLPYYDKAILEAKRVTRKYAIFCLFHPLVAEDQLKAKIKTEGKYHMNKYGRESFINLLENNFTEIKEVFVKDAQRDNQIFFCRK